MKISVLTPSFNSGDYIERAILSVQQQDYKNVEHIVIDGGSTDSTINILKKYSSVLWRSEKDNGQSDAMNKAFAESTGDIIVYLNADDYFEPNVFAAVIKSFEESSADIIVGNLYNRFYNNDYETLGKPSIVFKEILFPKRYLFPLNPVSYFYKRRVQESIGNFPIDEHFAMDYWFLLRAFHRFKTAKIELPLGTFFRTGLNKTSLNKNGQQAVENMAKKYICALGLRNCVWYNMANVWYNIRYAYVYAFWKIPFKYIYYIFFARNNFKDFSEFQKVGFKKHRIS